MLKTSAQRPGILCWHRRHSTPRNCLESHPSSLLHTAGSSSPRCLQTGPTLPSCSLPIVEMINSCSAFKTPRSRIPPRRRCRPSPPSLLPLCPADAPLSLFLSLRITNRWKLEAFSYAPLFVLVRLCPAQRRLVNAVVRSWPAVTPSVRSRSCPAMRGSLLPRRPGLLPEAQPTATVQKVQAPLATPGSGRRPPFDRLSMFPSSFSSS